jgi:hypothetical protein
MDYLAPVVHRALKVQKELQDQQLHRALSEAQVRRESWDGLVPLE